MDIVLDVFKNRPGKSIGSVITIILSIVTIVMFQELTIPTLIDFIDYLTVNEGTSTMLITWFLNLLSLVLLIGLGVLWIKDVAKDNYMDISPTTGRVTSFVVGIVHVGYSIFFINYVFSSLLGIVVAAIIAISILSSYSRKS